jgi:heme/copper-type cytochrome/quinol oxidase subunit 1
VLLGSFGFSIILGYIFLGLISYWNPEAHIPISPAFGLISEMLSKSSQCIIFGRDSMIIALLVIAFLGRIVRGHHTFMVGFDTVTLAYHTTATPIIAIPTGIKKRKD